MVVAEQAWVQGIREPVRGESPALQTEGYLNPTAYPISSGTVDR
jgi:hypothetical protein